MNNTSHGDFFQIKLDIYFNRREGISSARKSFILLQLLIHSDGLFSVKQRFTLTLTFVFIKSYNNSITEHINILHSSSYIRQLSSVIYPLHMWPKRIFQYITSMFCVFYLHTFSEGLQNLYILRISEIILS